MTLAELIDFELALSRDLDRPFAEVVERDRRIAAAVPTDAVSGPASDVLLRAWLEAQRGSTRPTVGERFAAFRGLLAGILFVAGFVLGAGAVTAWLVSPDRLPVNVVVFWPALVGVQVGLAALWWIAVIPPEAADRVPGLRELRRFLVAMGRAAPMIGTWLLRALGQRIARSAEMGTAMLRRMETLYGRLVFWIGVALTQVFAIGFNAGAWVALFAIPYFDDPAFGWRSRLLDASELHEVVRWIATPWSSWSSGSTDPSAWTVSLEEVIRTQYSSLDPELVDRVDTVDPIHPAGALAAARRSAWSAWWPFLLASLAVYGALPRMLFWGVAQWRSRRVLAAAPARHADVERLRVRLEGFAVETAGSGTAEVVRGPAGSATDLEPFPLQGRPIAVLCWPGPDRSETDLERLLGTAPSRLLSVHPAHPDAALRQLRPQLEVAPETGIVLAIEASEPPVGEVLDLIGLLRSELGRERPIAVGLRQAGGVEDRHRTVWKRVLAERGDPYLCLIELVSEAA